MQDGKVCNKAMKISINDDAKTINVIFSSKSQIPTGREAMITKKKILSENSLTLMSGYAIYFDYEKTERQLASIARKFDKNIANDSEIDDVSVLSIYEINHIGRYRQAGSSLRK